MKSSANEKMFFLQIVYEGLPLGTPLVGAEKSAAHHQATAMLNRTQVPTGYYKLVGAEGPATLAIPLFEGIVGEHHPTDPRVVGPFVCTGFGRVTEDKLPAGYKAYITPEYVYPYCTFTVCANVDSGGTLVRVESPKHTVINYREEVEKYLEMIRSRTGKELEVEYKDTY